MSLNRYLPSLPTVVASAITSLAVMLLVAYAISKVPAWQRLVREGSLNPN